MKMMILAPRRPGMSHEEFRRYVTEVHGPLVRSVPEVCADIRHYHYNFPVPGAEDPAFGHPIAGHLDIVTQGWFDSRQAQLRNMCEPRYLQIIRPDEGRFADESAAVMHYTRELTVIEGIATAHKIFYFRRRHPSLTRKAFQREWQKRYPPALGHHLLSSQTISRYVQNEVLTEDEHPGGNSVRYFDTIDEFCVPTNNSFASIARDVAARARIRAVEQDLLDGARTQCFVATCVHNIP